MTFLGCILKLETSTESHTYFKVVLVCSNKFCDKKNTYSKFSFLTETYTRDLISSNRQVDFFHTHKAKNRRPKTSF